MSVTNALSKVAPAVARQWHPTKNGTLRPRDVVAGSRRAAWWRCPKGPDHEWSAKIGDRLRGSGCPFCAGRRASATVNLAVAAPQLVPEWHPTKNGALRPQDVLPRSARRFWWRCARGHAWAARAAHRVDGHGCPFCAGVRVTRETSLAALDPALAKQWHPTKNGKLTPRDVTRGAHHRVWWRCRLGHEWQVAVNSRTGRGTGSPHCHQVRRERQVATTGRRRRQVRFAAYEGVRHGAVHRKK